MPPPDAASELVIEYLSGHDAACPACGYGLRGIADPVCPECAAPLHIEIASIRSSAGPWLLALVSWTLALGFDGVVALIFTTALAVTRPPLSQAYPYIFASTFTVLTLGGAVGISRVLRTRSMWVTRPRRTQWQHAFLTFFLVAGMHAAVGLTIVLAA